jgi:hypothetical protein
MKKLVLAFLIAAGILLLYFSVSNINTRAETENSKASPAAFSAAGSKASTESKTSADSKTSTESKTFADSKTSVGSKTSADSKTSAVSRQETSGTSEAVLSVNSLTKLPAGTIIDTKNQRNSTLKQCFYSIKLTKELKNRIQGKSYKDNCTLPYDDLRYVRVLYYGFDQKTHIGELMVNAGISKDVTAVFYELYKSKYPIEKMVLIDDYDADDNASMADNNTSAFNYRAVPGSIHLSKHALGLAIDINPLYNPYVKTSGKKSEVLPEESLPYTDRTLECPYYIKKNDTCYTAFINRGFIWGGSWNSLKDYQHFEKEVK